MGHLIANCPNCKAENMTMQVFAAYEPPPNFYGGDYSQWYAIGGATCGRCQFPFGVRIVPTKVRDIPKNHQSLAGAQKANDSFEHFGFTVALQLIEAKREPLEHLPDAIAKAMRQAEDNFNRKDMEEPAAVFFGRAIELALKHVHPDAKGTLASRIRKLAADREIPQAMAEWADEVRLVRNDGAHDDGVTREDLVAARDFADAFLRYLITMPEMVEKRRAKPTQ